MSPLRGYAWWLTVLALSPVLVPLAMRTRRQALRLPPAEGPQRGLAGADLAGEPLRLLVLGESTVVGVGVGCLRAALVGQLAEALAARQGRPVAWRACGENGITAAQACERLLPQVLGEPFDLALLVFGVNDTTHLTSLQRWRVALGSMAGVLARRGVRVAFSGGRRCSISAPCPGCCGACSACVRPCWMPACASSPGASGWGIIR